MIINAGYAQNEMSPKLDSQFGRLILAMAIVFGSFARFFPIILAKFPMVDGGMFYVAIGNILANKWRLPDAITYNQLNIPFTYPPLGFYFVALMEKISGINRLDIIQFLPPIYSALSILVIYYLAYVIFEKTSLAAIAAALYALLPRSLWLIMGGSITRAPGMIFSILTIANLYLVFFRGNYRKKWMVMLFGSLTVLSHPEAAIHTAGICLWFLLLATYKRKNIIQGLQILACIVLLTSPWWITILTRYGIQPIIAALGLGGGGITGSLMWPLTNFAEEQFLSIITVTALWGAIFKLYKKEFFLPVWLCIPFLISKRSAPGYSIIPLALLGSVAIVEFLTPAIAAIRTRNLSEDVPNEGHIFNILKVLVGIIIVYSFASAFWWGMITKDHYVLSEENQIAMQWVRDYTPPDAKFLILTGETSPGWDEIQEWFPVLSERVSLTTTQGKEWQSGNQFTQAAESTKQLQSECIIANVSCIEAWGAKNQVKYNFVYVVNTSNSPYRLPIIESLSLANHYELVYTSPQKEIYVFNYQD